jgi:hypothetical protein
MRLPKASGYPYQKLDMRNLEDENGGSWAQSVLKCGAS